MVALHVCHGLVNFGVQTPEIHAPQNSQKWHAWIDWDIFYFHSLDAICLSVCRQNAKKRNFCQKLSNGRPVRVKQATVTYLSDAVCWHF